MKIQVFLALVLAVVLAGCERVVIDDVADSVGDADGNVVLRVVAEPQQTGQTRGGVALSDVCGRLNVAVFDAEGKKVKTVAQVVSDAGFGTVGLSLSPGEYSVVAVAHNCTASATISSAEKVTFPSNKVTDTFYYYGTVTAGTERQEVAVCLERAVAMVRLKLTGTARDDVASLKFYYLGGSSTFSPALGFGSVNSKQTEYRAWSEDGVYEVYTLPHSTEDVLTRMTVTALDAGDNEIGECVLENVPVTVNRVTEWSGDVFGGGGSVNIGITVDPEWAGVDSYTF